MIRIFSLALLWSCSMSLPESRDFDAVDTGPLPAATVNNVQDAIVGRKHGMITKQLGLYLGGFEVDTVVSNQFAVTAEIVGIGNAIWELPLHVGDRIDEVRIYVREDTAGGQTFACNLKTLDNQGGSVSNVASVSSGLSGAHAILTMSSIAHVITTGVRMQVDASLLGSGNSNHRIYGIEVDYDHP